MAQRDVTYEVIQIMEHIATSLKRASVEECTFIHGGVYCCDARHGRLRTEVYQQIQRRIRDLGGDFVTPPNWDNRRLFYLSIEFTAPAPTLENLRDLWNLRISITSQDGIGKSFIVNNYEHNLLDRIGVAVIDNKLHRIITVEI